MSHDDDARSNRTVDTPAAKAEARAADDKRQDRENAISPSMSREAGHGADTRAKLPDNEAKHEAAPPTNVPKARKAKASLEVGDVPEEIAERYFTEARGKGQGYYPDAQTKEAAFHDTGNKLSAERTDPNVIADMLKVAEHRGWNKLDVSGTAEFRREVWMQGQDRGIEVVGYKPTERDLQELGRRQQGRALETGGEIRQRDANGSTSDKNAERPAAETGVTGKLVEAGQAPYQDRKDADPSPYVKLELEGGQSKTLWGVGLPDALQRAGAEIGDTVTVKRDGFEQVTKQVMVRDAETGKPVHDSDTGKPVYEEKSVDRGMWTVTAERFLTADKGTRLSDPALRGPESQMRVIESYVNSRVADPAARDRLVAGARREIAKELAKGADIPTAQVRVRVRDDRTAERPAFRNKGDAQHLPASRSESQNRQSLAAGKQLQLVQERMVRERERQAPERDRSR